MTESRDCLTCANKYNVESDELQMENLPETQSMCPVRVSVALAYGWVVVGCCCPPGPEVYGRGTCVGLPGSLARVAPEAWGFWGRGSGGGLDATLSSSRSSQAATRPRLRPREVESTGSVLRVLRTASLQRVGCVFKTSGSAGAGGADALGGAPESRLDRLPGLEKLSMARSPYTHTLCPASRDGGIKAPVPVPIRDSEAPFGLGLGPGPRGGCGERSWVGQ